MINALKKLFLQNFIIKFFSVVFAIFLWLHVVAKGTTEVNFVVPLELRDIPEGMMVVGDVPGYVDVRIQGQEGLIRRLAIKDISAFVSLTDARSGEQFFPLSTSNVSVPGTLKVASVTPSEVRLRLEKLTRRELRVKAELTGTPAPGFKVYKVAILPENVTATGPESSLKRVKFISTASIDIDGVSAGFDRVVPLDPPSESGVKLDESKVRVSVSVARYSKNKGDE